MTALERFRSWVSELESAGFTRTQVAARVGCSESGLSKILSGKRGAGGRNAARIEIATAEWPGGPIRAVDWYAETEAA